MATQPKKNSTKATSKKKSTSPKKTVANKKISKKRKSKKTTSFKKNIFIILGVSLTLLLITLGYFLGKNDRVVFPKNVIKKEQSSTKDLLNNLANLKVKQPKKEERKKLEKVVVKPKKKVEKPLLQERGQTQNVITEVKKKVKQKKNNIALAYRAKKPKLVIIIDDVHTKRQIQAIKKLGLKITPSIFPPYALAKHSNLLAKQVNHYMIHLPMESGNKQLNTQAKTLMTSFSDEQIADRVMEIRYLFPKAKYINNHTGSVFTSHYKAMKKLYIALKLEGFTFVDSYTVASSKVSKIAHEQGDAYVRRDIFIDNTHTVSYIHKQLKIAVQKAKKNGYAIAIGHPHKITMKALASAQQVLKDVELVYIDDIYRKEK